MKKKEGILMTKLRWKVSAYGVSNDGEIIDTWYDFARVDWKPFTFLNTKHYKRFFRNIKRLVRASKAGCEYTWEVGTRFDTDINVHGQLNQLVFYKQIFRDGQWIVNGHQHIININKVAQ
tara:strand:+ start:128 stop:487 length:360 start_codon:yes stop_codon:yes gene_type:complete